MNDPILIGTLGWEHPEWEGAYYPPELPPEWRFCFYSNKARSVIVPASAWATVRAPDVTQWVDDSDPAFRFILELPPALLETEDALSAVVAFFAPLVPIRDMTAALLLPLSASTSASRLDALLRALAVRHPVCLRPQDASFSEEQRQCARRHRASICWQVGKTEAPEPGGNFLIALMEEGNPKQLREALEHLAVWQSSSGGNCGLFFSRPETAASLAHEARLLAEMMQL